MDDIDPKKLTLPHVSKPVCRDNKSLPKHKNGEKFLKGPIPWDRWLSIAAKGSGRGKSLHVAMALWFLAGMNNKATVTLSGTVLKDLGVKRNAAYRGLNALERAGLVSVIRHNGRSPIVTILEQKG